MKKTLLLLIACAALLSAHHGWEDFDAKSELTFEATVKDFHFTNPHCVVEFEAKDDKGQLRKWQGEFASPIELHRNGWTAASLQVGDKITITGHPSKDGAPAIHVMKIRLASGKELPIYNGR